ncbi:hypothetical protein WJ60_06280 [Burkholderia ubonensis]|uniref:hypothetical protein n=1 Tax=Burkholderia ubonensis TaxID=101571 RepID=UPI00075E6A57|nr:hypothetical protein [Burkholderia ubonensis]KVM73918.1 hypothetical protein WJ60_06280 [Burkholderia ubonensis]
MLLTNSKDSPVFAVRRAPLFAPERATVKSDAQFVDLLRRVSNDGDITPCHALLLRNRLDELKLAAMRSPYEEVGGPALTLRVFRDFLFTKSDLPLIKLLRDIVHDGAGFAQAETSESFRPSDFDALAKVATLSVAVSEVVSRRQGTPAGSLNACRNLYARLDQNDSESRWRFMKSPLGLAVEAEWERLARWVG